MTRAHEQGAAWAAYRAYAVDVTVAIGQHLMDGRPVPPEVDQPTAFPPAFSRDERIWAGGPFRLLDFRALGDGSYVHNSTFALGGLAFIGAVHAVNAIGNAGRRAAAQRDAVPRWVQIDQGTLFVSELGMYLQTVNGLWPWSWDSIDSGQLVGPGLFHITGQSTGGPVGWQVESPFAELAFLCWARARHPRHQQLHDGTWAAGWVPRAQQPPPALPPPGTV